MLLMLELMLIYELMLIKIKNKGEKYCKNKRHPSFEAVCEKNIARSHVIRLILC